MEYLACEAPTIRLGDIGNHYGGPASAGLPLRCRTLLNLHDGRIMRGYTVDVAEDQLVVRVPTQLSHDQECAVFFIVGVAEHTFTIVGTGYVVRCTGSDAEGYRADLRFVVEDKKSRIAMEQLFSAERSNRIR